MHSRKGVKSVLANKPVIEPKFCEIEVEKICFKCGELTAAWESLNTLYNNHVRESGEQKDLIEKLEASNKLLNTMLQEDKEHRVFLQQRLDTAEALYLRSGASQLMSQAIKAAIDDKEKELSKQIETLISEKQRLENELESKEAREREKEVTNAAKEDDLCKTECRSAEKIKTSETQPTTQRCRYQLLDIPQLVKRNGLPLDTNNVTASKKTHRRQRKHSESSDSYSTSEELTPRKRVVRVRADENSTGDYNRRTERKIRHVRVGPNAESSRNINPVWNAYHPKARNTAQSAECVSKQAGNHDKILRMSKSGPFQKWRERKQFDQTSDTHSKKVTLSDVALSRSQNLSKIKIPSINAVPNFSGVITSNDVVTDSSTVNSLASPSKKHSAFPVPRLTKSTRLKDGFTKLKYENTAQQWVSRPGPARN